MVPGGSVFSSVAPITQKNDKDTGFPFISSQRRNPKSKTSTPSDELLVQEHIRICLLAGC